MRSGKVLAVHDDSALVKHKVLEDELSSIPEIDALITVPWGALWQAEESGQIVPLRYGTLPPTPIVNDVLISSSPYV
jgi:hypothetical protein